MAKNGSFFEHEIFSFWKNGIFKPFFEKQRVKSILTFFSQNFRKISFFSGPKKRFSFFFHFTWNRIQKVEKKVEKTTFFWSKNGKKCNFLDHFLIQTSLPHVQKGHKKGSKTVFSTFWKRAFLRVKKWPFLHRIGCKKVMKKVKKGSKMGVFGPLFEHLLKCQTSKRVVFWKKGFFWGFQKWPFFDPFFKKSVIFWHHFNCYLYDFWSKSGNKINFKNDHFWPIFDPFFDHFVKMGSKSSNI